MPTFTVFKGDKSGAVRKTTTTKPDELTRDLVLLKVTASGLCGTDLHYRHVDMVLGHEGVGIVEATGPDCTHLKKGDRVGWGYEHDSCGHCRDCLTGTEHYCNERQMYGFADLDQGSFASHAIWREAFLFKLPDEVADEDAAPFMCGGATVWQALMQYNARPTETIGVMGLGGLGHMAVKFARAMGSRVVVFSGSESKKEEALKLGAHEFVATKGQKELKVSRRLDRLLVTTSFKPDWELIMPIMNPGSTIFPLFVADGDFTIPYSPMVQQGIAIQGSVVAARQMQKDMLAFVALHNIKPVLQKFPMTEEGIVEAMDKLDRGEIHFRAVLVPQ